MPRAEGPSTITIFRVVFTAAAALVVLYAVYLVRSLVLLVLVAAFLAVGLDPVVRWLQRRGLKRGQAVAVLFLGLVLIFAGFGFAIVPPLVEQVETFATNVPEYVDDLADRNQRIAEFVDTRNITERLRSATTDLPSQLGGSFGTVLGIAGSIIASIFNTITVIVLTVYFSLSLTGMREGSLRLIPKSKRERTKELMDGILMKIGGYIAGNIAISLIAGVVSFAFLALVGVPFPVALALWVAIADLIPLIGATVGALPAVIVAYFVSLPVGLATTAFFAVYQMMENYFIAPRVMTKAIDISAPAVLVAALVGGSLLGVPGVLMAIPAAAAIKLLVNELVYPRTEEA